MSDCQDWYQDQGQQDPETFAVANRLFDLFGHFRGPRPLHRLREGDQEDRELHRQRHGQMRMLGALQRAGPLTVQDLARVLDVSAPTASVLAKRAFEEGLVERRGDDSDSRIVWLEIAPGGRDRVWAHRTDRVRSIERMISDRPDVDRGELSQAVDVLLRFLAPAPGTDDPLLHHQIANGDRQHGSGGSNPEDRS